MLDLRMSVGPGFPPLFHRIHPDPDDARLIELTAGPIHDDAQHAEALSLLRAHSAMARARDEAHRGRHIASLASGVQLRLSVMPEQMSADAAIVLSVLLSQHPPEHRARRQRHR